MTQEIENRVLEIDTEIRRHEWFDFHVVSFDGFELTIAGSIDLTYYHTLEIIFGDIFFVSGFFQGWRSDTKQSTFLLPGNAEEMNKKYEIEQGYQLFIFRTEDYTNDVPLSMTLLQSFSAWIQNRIARQFVRTERLCSGLTAQNKIL